jgi:hypothetical protein
MAKTTCIHYSSAILSRASQLVVSNPVYLWMLQTNLTGRFHMVPIIHFSLKCGNSHKNIPKSLIWAILFTIHYHRITLTISMGGNHAQMVGF